MKWFVFILLASLVLLIFLVGANVRKTINEGTKANKELLRGAWKNRGK